MSEPSANTAAIAFRRSSYWASFVLTRLSFYGGMICKNPYYVPPEELLKPNQAAREVANLIGVQSTPAEGPHVSHENHEFSLDIPGC